MKSDNIVVNWFHKDKGYLGTEEIPRDSLRYIGFFPEDPVVIDYLKLMEGNDGQEEKAKVSMLRSELRNLRSS